MSEATLIREIAEGRVLDAVSDLAHDLMGCGELLEDVEGIENSELSFEVLAEGLSAEFQKIHDWLVREWTPSG